MHILVLGATGNIGPILVRELLSAGHTIVIYARSPHKLPSDIATHPSVVVVKGELADEAGVRSALSTPPPPPLSTTTTTAADSQQEDFSDPTSNSNSKVTAVISTLGPPVSILGALRYPPGTPLANGISIFIREMKELAVNRLIALGTASMKDPMDKRDPVFAALVLGVHVSAPRAYADVVAINKVIRESHLGLGEGTAGETTASAGWTIARVPLLTNGETREYQVGYVGDGQRTTTLTRVAFAAFVVDELERAEFGGRAPLVTVP